MLNVDSNTFYLTHLPEYVTAFGIVVSLFILAINVRHSRASETRDSLRRLLAEDSKDLGQAIYEVVATAKVFTHKTGEESEQNWRRKLAASKTKIASLRHRVRYSLHGMDEPIHSVERFADWIIHTKANRPQSCDALLEVATAIRKHLDDVVITCLKQGRLPDQNERAIGDTLAKDMRLLYGSYAEIDDDLDENV
jgi:hypothetical protein